MEHYWCLRWLLQEGVTECTASVIRENLVRFDRLPIVTRLADMPNQEAQARVRVAIGRIDLLAPSVELRFAGRLDPEASEAADPRAARSVGIRATPGSPRPPPVRRAL